MTGSPQVERGPRTDEPRSNGDPAEVERKLALLNEPHVAPLTALVERLREQRGRRRTPSRGSIRPRPGSRRRSCCCSTRPAGKTCSAATAALRFVSRGQRRPDVAQSLAAAARRARRPRPGTSSPGTSIPWFVGRRSVGRRDAEEAQPALRESGRSASRARGSCCCSATPARDAWNEAQISDACRHRDRAGPEPALAEPRSPQAGGAPRGARQRAQVGARSTAPPSAPAPDDAKRRTSAGSSRPRPSRRDRRPGRQGHLASRAAARRARRRREPDPRVRARGGHRVDARRRARDRGRGDRGRTSTTLRVHGVGLRGAARARGADRLRQRRHARCGSRCGLLAGQAGRVRARRRRVALAPAAWSASPTPLRLMGAERRDDRRPRCRSRSRARALQRRSSYELPVASAQVKSAILLAGLGASGPTTVRRAAARRATTPS